MEWITLLQRFGASIGVEGLAPDEDNSCSLLFDGEHEVFFTHDDEDHSVLMYSELGSAGRLSKDGCLMLLKVSLLGAQTGGASFSIQDKQDVVVLWKRLDDTISEDYLKVVVNGFLGQAIAWKQKLAQWGRESAQAQEGRALSSDALSYIGDLA